VEAAIDAAIIAALNAILPPVAATLRLPFTLALGFVLVLVHDTYTLRVIRRIVRRQAPLCTKVPGIVFLEIDGLALGCYSSHARR
jgi:uncharacterized membrane protein YvlD (DUF360 family)